MDQVGQQASGALDQIKSSVGDMVSGKSKSGGVLEGLHAESGIGSLVASPFAPLFNTISAAIKPVTDNYGKLTPGGEQMFENFATSKAGDATSQVAQGLADAGNVAGSILGADQMVKAAPNIATTVQQGHAALADMLDAKGNAAIDQVRSIKASVANPDPRLQVSAERTADPLQKYNEFATQATNAVKDVKADAPIATVGSRIGDAYSTVVKMRQAVGQQMASELEGMGNKTAPVTDSIGAFQKELLDNGAKYDTINKEVTGGSNSKFSTSDKTLLSKYASELQALGKNPTMQELDAFVSRMPNEIQGLKSSSSITFKTNAERIINNNLNSLRDTLTQNGTPEYAAARKSYSSLSNFLDEGSKYLGKKTQSGDFAKDTSLAKSSAESLLAGGKKDWLVKLEGLTGYPALDESTLAIQAMKDAGDTRGLSLFKSLADGGIESPSGIVSKVIGYGANLAKRAVVGGPADQTRAFLQSLTPSEGPTALGNAIREPSLGLSMKDVSKLNLTPDNQFDIEKELSNYDANPMTVNGKIDLSKSGDMFQLHQLQEKLGQGPLTKDEYHQAYYLMKKGGIDALK